MAIRLKSRKHSKCTNDTRPPKVEGQKTQNCIKNIQITERSQTNQIWKALHMNNSIQKNLKSKSLTLSQEKPLLICVTQNNSEMRFI